MDDGSLQLDTEEFLEAPVGNGGSSGIIYVPIEHAGERVKVIIPAGNGELPEIVDKKIGRGKICGVIYVHKKHLGKQAKIVFIKTDKRGE